MIAFSFLVSQLIFLCVRVKLIISYLKQVVLHDVAYDAELVEVAAASLSAERLLECESDGGDRVPVPQLLHDLVGEAQHDYVLDHFLAEVVVDAVDLLLGEEGCDVFGEGVGRVEVFAERLLDNDAGEVGPA